jgi:hypothetical protein
MTSLHNIQFLENTFVHIRQVFMALSVCMFNFGNEIIIRVKTSEYYCSEELQTDH